MDLSKLIEKANRYLDTLCNQIPGRSVGSAGNRRATTFFADTIRSFGFDVECPEFECMDWQTHGATLSVEDASYQVFASPYTLGVQVKAPLITACSVSELEALDISNRILLMRGELTKEQFLPKNFPFFQVEEQQKVIHLLERKHPLALITATTHNPEMAGALYPFPVFEDGDFDTPSVYMTEEQGAQLARQEGSEISLEIRAERIPSRGCNVVARKGANSARRIVLCAHIDAKPGTPGALDNGTGIITLLLVAELLKGYSGDHSIEIVALNGEDYYSNPGELLYLQQNEGKFDEIVLGINIDGMGYTVGRTAYSLYDCPPDMVGGVRAVFAVDESFVAGEPWFQGDHALFLMNGRPALALTSERVAKLMAEFVHTERDTAEIVDPQKVAATALALHRLLMSL
jgi:aminopeptidase YwaD